MANPLKLLSKLFNKHPDNVVVSELYSKMAQPLFVHPHLGEMVMRSYLDAITLQPNSLAQDESEGGYSTRSDNIAVLDISGALVAREMNVPCGQSPASYEGIKQEMQELINDPSISTIVGRFDSPGGMAAQNMDLSDFIYASRGQGTKLVAMVDDMAYSAAFGIASAFDEIWVTRTSGVGSVGVVSYHVDQSEANAKAGIKVEYIYAGDKKVLGNPHEALSEEGRASYQQEVSRLYTLFTATVARNLGMTIEAVQATQAGTFHGEEAVAAGFAHQVGTFDELLASLFESDEKSPDASKNATIISQEDHTPEILAEADADVEVPVVEATEDKPEELADAKVEPELEQNVEEVLQESTETIITDAEEEPEKNLEQSAQEAVDVLAKQRESSIRALSMSAGVPDAAQDFIDSGMSVDDVRTSLLDLTATPESNIVSSSPIALKRDRSDVKAGWKQAHAIARKSK